jgi:arylsulfatase A-like enzyme
VSNVDLAPTIAELAGATLAEPVDGRSIVPLLRGEASSGWRTGVLAEFRGSREIPSWWELRTRRYAYIEYGTGETELYDVEGALGRADPYELRNVAGTPRYADEQQRLAEELRAMRGE